MKTFLNTDQIRVERQNQRSNPVIYSLLGVVLGELDRRSNPNIPATDSDIYKVIKKLYDAAIECHNIEEEKYLEQFIKKQMSEDELRNAVRGIIEGSGIKDMGGVMRCLSMYYSGQYDGKTASIIGREELSKLSNHV